jgi:hypothetical protein
VTTADRAKRLLLPASYVLLNLPFLAKYPVRAGLGLGVAIGGYLVAVVIAWTVSRRLKSRVTSLRLSPWATLAAAVVVAAGLTVVMRRFDPEAIHVTRYAALDQWIARLFAGEFPYASTAAPSSFPFMFVWAMPWYLLGDLGLLQIVSWIAFAALCAWSARDDQARAVGALAALLGSPLFLYEVVTRSELFSNMVLVLAVVLALERVRRGRDLVGVAVAAGLALSTRGIVALVGAVALPFRFRREPLRGLAFAAIAGVVFAATLAPFVLWDRDAFLRHGPFSIQLSYAPRGLVAAAFALALALGWRARGPRDVVLGTALALAMPVAAVFLWSVATEGWRRVLLGDDFDISYFAFAHTFLIYAAARFGWGARAEATAGVASATRPADP